MEEPVYKPRLYKGKLFEGHMRKKDMIKKIDSEPCKFCGIIPICDLHWHYARYHRYDIEEDKFTCGHCHQNIPENELKTHGMETCVLCNTQFQHCSREDWSFRYSWGVIEKYRSGSSCSGENEPPPNAKKFIKINGNIIGEAYSLENLPDGIICSDCLCDDKRITYIWSH